MAWTADMETFTTGGRSRRRIGTARGGTMTDETREEGVGEGGEKLAGWWTWGANADGADEA